MKAILETEDTGFIGGIEVGLENHVEDCMSVRQLQGIIWYFKVLLEYLKIIRGG